jgi:hypothetical protein
MKDGRGRMVHGSMRQFCAVALLATGLVSLGASAQDIQTPECNKAGMEMHLRFSRGPGHIFNLVVTGKNISGQPCIFDHDLFDPDNGSNRGIKCRDCRLDLRDGKNYRPRPVIGPGEISREQYRWITVAAGDCAECISPTPSEWGTGCIRPAELRSEAWLLKAPSLLADMCSEIHVVGVDILRPSDAEAGVGADVSLRLTALRPAYYVHERMPLRIAGRENNAKSVPVNKCAPLYLWSRTADGSTEMREINTDATNGCAQQKFNYEPNFVFADSEWRSPADERRSNYGEQQLQIFELHDAPPEGPVELAASNELKAQIYGGENRNLRHWTETKGLAADVLLDQDTYRLGENVPLHLVIANFEASAPIYIFDPNWDPCFSLSIEVLDGSGNPLPEEKRDGVPVGCSGHGFAPRLMPKGELIALEWNLKWFGWLPKEPGDYSIVLNWCASTGKEPKWGKRGWKAKMRPYATVEAKAVLHVVGAK